VTCPVCGLTYCSDLKEDRATHRAAHRKYRRQYLRVYRQIEVGTRHRKGRAFLFCAIETLRESTVYERIADRVFSSVGSRLHNSAKRVHHARLTFNVTEARSRK
jgi:uncharacterized Zn finger protein (UPF0148 family)